jgi:hypothetical protein
MKELQAKIQEAIDAADILLEAKLYRQAATKYWEATRSAIFYHLKEQNISFSSTKQALKQIVNKYQNDKLSDLIIFAESISILCEWDEYFEIKTDQIYDYAGICSQIIVQFVNAEFSNKKIYYYILQKEINRHKEDLEYTKATQFAAAERNADLYIRWLTFGFLLTLIGISCLLCSVIKICHFCENWIGETIAILGAIATLWPLVRDYSGKAVHHKRTAEELNNLYKQCLNWETIFYDKKNFEEIKTFVMSIRNLFSVISSLAPLTEKRDYQTAKRNIDKGSYKYADKILNN